MEFLSIQIPPGISACQFFFFSFKIFGRIKFCNILSILFHTKNLEEVREVNTMCLTGFCSIGKRESLKIFEKATCIDEKVYLLKLFCQEH